MFGLTNIQNTSSARLALPYTPTISTRTQLKIEAHILTREENKLLWAV